MFHSSIHFSFSTILFIQPLNLVILTFFLSENMGAYKYMQEIWRKKQSDALRYLLRIRTWHYRQLSAVHRVPRPTRPEKARRLGYRAKQGKIVKIWIKF